MARSMAALVLLGLASVGCAAAHTPGPLAVDVPVYEGKPMEFWLGEMKDLAPARRAPAELAVTQFGVQATPFLASMLRDGRVHVRESAARALDRMGLAAASAGAALVEAMEDPDPGVRMAAWGAVVNLGLHGVFVPGAVEAKERAVGMEKDPRSREAVEKDLAYFRRMMAEASKAVSER